MSNKQDTELLITKINDLRYIIDSLEKKYNEKCELEKEMLLEIKFYNKLVPILINEFLILLLHTKLKFSYALIQENLFFLLKVCYLMLFYH